MRIRHSSYYISIVDAHANDAAAALAFGHFNGEKEVNEPYGSNGKHNRTFAMESRIYFVDEALKLCDALEITGSPQRLIMPIMRTMDANQVHDLFPVIVRMPDVVILKTAQNSD
ncbi:unnamed protein product [Ceratitis capitata]|uniref:(Mediterranean fruit fly) hypothetical protein n=1 Tax=Ceratitis capitata TaxID=7213 RepID=A0A811VAS2_CERCA|nr:unnamed protein product [Ceratitis capitata]